MSCSRSPGHAPGHAVEEPRGDPPRERVAPLRLPAGHEVEALVELRQQAGDLGRVVLEVAVDRDDDVAGRLREAGVERGRLAEVAAQAHDAHVVVDRVQPGQARRTSRRVEPSSTNTTSHGRPERVERRRELVVQERSTLAPRRGRGRRPRSRPRGYSAIARRDTGSVGGVTDLLSIDEALASRARARAAARQRRWCALARRSTAASSPSPRRARRRPAAVRELGDGRLRDARRRHARERCRVVGESPPGGPRRGRWRPGEAIGDRHRRSRPGAARTRSCRSSMLSHQTTAIEVASGVAVGDNVRPRGGDVRAGDEVVPSRACGSAPAQLGALAAAGVAEVVCGRRPRVRVLTTGTRAAAGRASRWRPARSTSRTASCSRRRSRSAGAVVERVAARARRRAARTATRSSTGSRPTCSSPRAACRSDRTISSAGSSASSASRRSSGASRCDRESRSRSASEGRRSCSGCPATRSRRSSAAMLFVRPGAACAPGCAEPGPALRWGALASAVRRNPARDDFSALAAAVATAVVVLTPIAGQESHMIVRSADRRCARPRPARRGRAGRRRGRALPPLWTVRRLRRPQLPPDRACAGAGRCRRVRLYRPTASAPSCAATAAQASSASTVGQGTKPTRHQARRRRAARRAPRAKLLRQRDDDEHGADQPDAEEHVAAQPERAALRAARATRRATAAGRRARNGWATATRERDARRARRAPPRSRRARSSALGRALAGRGHDVRRASPSATSASERRAARDRPVGHGRAVRRRRQRRVAVGKTPTSAPSATTARPTATDPGACAARATRARSGTPRCGSAREVDRRRRGTGRASASRTSSIAQPRTTRSPR